MRRAFLFGLFFLYLLLLKMFSIRCGARPLEAFTHTHTHTRMFMMVIYIYNLHDAHIRSRESGGRGVAASRAREEQKVKHEMFILLLLNE